MATRAANDKYGTLLKESQAKANPASSASLSSSDTRLFRVSQVQIMDRHTLYWEGSHPCLPTMNKQNQRGGVMGTGKGERRGSNPSTTNNNNADDEDVGTFSSSYYRYRRRPTTFDEQCREPHLILTLEQQHRIVIVPIRSFARGKTLQIYATIGPEDLNSSSQSISSNNSNDVTKSKNVNNSKQQEIAVKVIYPICVQPLSPDVFLIGASDGSIQFYSLGQQKVIRTIQAHHSSQNSNVDGRRQQQQQQISGEVVIGIRAALSLSHIYDAGCLPRGITTASNAGSHNPHHGGGGGSFSHYTTGGAPFQPGGGGSSCSASASSNTTPCGEQIDIHTSYHRVITIGSKGLVYLWNLSIVTNFHPITNSKKRSTMDSNPFVGQSSSLACAATKKVTSVKIKRPMAKLEHICLPNTSGTAIFKKAYDLIHYDMERDLFIAPIAVVAGSGGRSSSTTSGSSNTNLMMGVWDLSAIPSGIQVPTNNNSIQSGTGSSLPKVIAASPSSISSGGSFGGDTIASATSSSTTTNQEKQWYKRYSTIPSIEPFLQVFLPTNLFSLAPSLVNNDNSSSVASSSQSLEKIRTAAGVGTAALSVLPSPSSVSSSSSTPFAAPVLSPTFSSLSSTSMNYTNLIICPTKHEAFTNESILPLWIMNEITGDVAFVSISLLFATGSRSGRDPTFKMSAPGPSSKGTVLLPHVHQCVSFANIEMEFMNKSRRKQHMKNEDDFNNNGGGSGSSSSRSTSKSSSSSVVISSGPPQRTKSDHNIISYGRVCYGCGNSLIVQSKVGCFVTTISHEPKIFAKHRHVALSDTTVLFVEGSYVYVANLNHSNSNTNVGNNATRATLGKANLLRFVNPTLVYKSIIPGIISGLGATTNGGMTDSHPYSASTTNNPEYYSEQGTSSFFSSSSSSTLASTNIVRCRTRSLPNIFISPSGNFVCLFWTSDLHYEILHIPTLLRSSSSSSSTTRTAAGGQSQPLVEWGSNIVSFAWIGGSGTQHDVYAILRAQDTSKSDPTTTSSQQQTLISSSNSKTLLRLGHKKIKLPSRSGGDKRRGQKENDDYEDDDEEELQESGVELRLLVMVNHTAIAVASSSAPATVRSLGNLLLRGGQPLYLFGGPVLCVATAHRGSTNTSDGLAYFYTHRRRNKSSNNQVEADTSSVSDLGASSFTSVGTSLPLPDLVEWSNDGTYCCVCIGARACLYKSTIEDGFVLAGVVQFPNHDGTSAVQQQTRIIQSVTFLHGMLYCCTRISMYAVFLGSINPMKGGILSINSYKVASFEHTMVSDIITSSSYSFDGGQLAPISTTICMESPSVLCYFSGNLVLSTTTGLQWIKLDNPLLRTGALLVAGHQTRAEHWIKALMKKRSSSYSRGGNNYYSSSGTSRMDIASEVLTAFLKNRGYPTLVAKYISNKVTLGISTSTLMDIVIQWRQIKILDELIDDFGFDCIRGVQLSSNATTRSSSVSSCNSAIECIGTLLLAEGKAELLRRLASECILLNATSNSDNGEDNNSENDCYREEAYTLAVLLLAVDSTDAKRILKRATGMDSGGKVVASEGGGGAPAVSAWSTFNGIKNLQQGYNIRLNQ